MDLESIPGTLDVMQEYSMDQMPVHYRASHTHIHTLTVYSHAQSQQEAVYLPVCFVLEQGTL